ncbi:MAG: helix-turn-helix transcriptional regulator [Acidobacteriota bacterium]|nr:helix-turn-helix transcriptional regulator [Acidobacteriota bacterium]
MNLALTVLRVIRGWNQDDLSKASGIRNSSVSDYERGRKMPELKTLERLVGAMGYPLSAVDHARTFIHALRTESILSDYRPRGGTSRTAAVESPPSPGFDSPAALRWEVEQVSVEAGRVVTRLARVMFILMSRAGSLEPPAPVETIESESDRS